MFGPELASAKEKEEEIKEKKKVNPVRKAYTSGVGKFIHPNMKKEARYSSLNIFYEIIIYPNTHHSTDD